MLKVYEKPEKVHPKEETDVKDALSRNEFSTMKVVIEEEKNTIC